MRRVAFLTVATIILVCLSQFLSPLQTVRALEFRENKRVDRDVGKGSRANPSIEVSDGSIHIVWEDDRSGSWDIYYSKSNNNGTSFLPDVQVNDDPSEDGVHHLCPDVSAHNGTVYVVWQDERSGLGSEIFFSKSLDGYSFSPNLKISDSGTEEMCPSLAVDRNSGILYVAWASKDREIRLARSLDGGENFESSVLVSDVSANQTRDPKVAVDPEGKVYVVWSDARAGKIPGRDEEDFDIYIANSTTWGKSFGIDTRVNDMGYDIVQTNPSISIDGKGTVYVVWEDGRLGSRDIFFSKSLDGSNFTQEILVNDALIHRRSPHIIHTSPCVAVHPTGSPIFVVWTDDRGDNHNIYIAESTDGGNSFHTANSEYGGNFFFDRNLPYNGVRNFNEAVILDDGNGILDPGVLNGSDSPDRIVLSAPADFGKDLMGDRITFVDMNENEAWDKEEDIVIDMPGVSYSGLKPTRKNPEDNTTGNFITFLRYDLRLNDSVYYTVDRNERMVVGWFDLERFGLKVGDPLNSVEIEVAYKTDIGYDGTRCLGWSFSLAKENPIFQVVNTGGVEVYENADLFALGVDRVEELRELNISFLNDEPSDRKVYFNSISLTIGVGFQDGYDIHDIVVYDGLVVSTQGKHLSLFSDSDDLVFMDFNGSGLYERGEPLFILNGDGSEDAISEFTEVLTRADGDHWNAVFDPFPLNDDIGSSSQEHPDLGLDSMGNPYVVWGDSRFAFDAVFFATPAQDLFPPELVYCFPHNGSLNVSLYSTISLVFSETMSSDALSNVRISPLTNGSWFWNSDRTNLTFVPFLPLKSNVTYTIRVAGAKDLSGNSLSSEFVSYFRTIETPVITHTPSLEPFAIKEPIEVLARISDNDSIADVTLFYLGVGERNLSQRKMSLVSGSFVNGSWSAYLPAQRDIGFLFYYIVAEDIYGNAGRSPLIGRHYLLIIDDTSPSITHIPIRTATAGTKVTFTATATDDLEILNVKLYIKPVGASNFNPPFLMERVGSTDEFRYELSLPNKDGEIYYYIKVVDRWGNAEYSGNVSSPHKVSVTGAPLDLGPFLSWTLVFLSIAFLYFGMFLFFKKEDRKREKEG